MIHVSKKFGNAFGKNVKIYDVDNISSKNL